MNDTIEFLGFNNCKENYKSSNVFNMWNMYYHHISYLWSLYTCNCDMHSDHMASTCIIIHKTKIIYNSDIKSFWYK